MKQSFNSVLATPETEAAAGGVQCKNVFLQISQNTCANQTCNFIKKETQARVFL